MAAAVTEHPIETARRALRQAALVEPDAEWRGLLLRFADALPPAPLPPRLPGGVVVDFDRRRRSQR